MQFMQQCWADHERTDIFATASLGLIGDFATTYGEAVRNEMLQEWVSQALQYGKGRGVSRRAKTNAQYAQKAIKEYIK